MTDDEIREGILHIKEAWARLQADNASAEDNNLIQTIAVTALLARDREAGLKAGLEMVAEMRGRPRLKVV